MIIIPYEYKYPIKDALLKLNKEILLKDAISINKKNENLKVGDKIYEELPQVDFGRIAAQSAKQVISQKVREAEKNRQYEDFKDKQPRLIFEEYLLIKDLWKFTYP